MKRTLFATAALGLLTVLALPAFSQPGPMGPEDHDEFRKERLSEIDTDGDGNVSDAERAAFKAAKFASADANGDGGVTLEEMRAFKENERVKREAERFSRIDTDGDGRISEEEFLAAPMHGHRRGKHKKRKMRHAYFKDMMLERFDADGDGMLNDAEREAARADMKAFKDGALEAPTDQ